MTGKYDDERYDEWDSDAKHGLGWNGCLPAICATISRYARIDSYSASQIST